MFASHGWVFFGPYRRGQGLSASAGPYIGDQIAAAEKSGGISAGAAAMVRLLETDHLNDQLAALAWLRKQGFVQADRIAVAGNSFGGIEAVLGAGRGDYCAAIDSAGGAQSWAEAPALQSLMTRAVRNARAPIFFFQAANDYDLSPSKTLSAVMKDAGKAYQLKIYPQYGNSPQDGHTFAILDPLFGPMMSSDFFTGIAASSRLEPLDWRPACPNGANRDSWFHDRRHSVLRLIIGCKPAFWPQRPSDYSIPSVPQEAG